MQRAQPADCAARNAALSCLLGKLMWTVKAGMMRKWFEGGRNPTRSAEPTLLPLHRRLMHLCVCACVCASHISMKFAGSKAGSIIKGSKKRSSLEQVLFRSLEESPF